MPIFKSKLSPRYTFVGDPITGQEVLIVLFISFYYRSRRVELYSRSRRVDLFQIKYS